MKIIKSLVVYSLLVSGVYANVTICEKDKMYDIVVLGGTASGVGAAITASREKKSVCFITRVTKKEAMGGMITSGLNFSDSGIPSSETVNSYLDESKLTGGDILQLNGDILPSGLFNEFRNKIKKYYGSNADGLHHTPTIASKEIINLLNKENISYLLGYVITKTKKLNEKIISIEIEKLNEKNGAFIENTSKIIKAKFFIDATDTGDMAELSGVEFREMREKPTDYNEGFAGKLYWNPYTMKFIYNQEKGYVTPKLQDSKTDNKVQAYSYFLTVKNTNPVQKIENIQVWKNLKLSSDICKSYTFGGAPSFSESWAFKNGWSPDKKHFEVNVHPKGSDLQKRNYQYHTANWEERIRIENDYKKRALCFIKYWQSTGENVSLDTDSFDNGIPYRMYIRESRRIVGKYTFSEQDSTPYNLYKFRENQENGKGFKLEWRKYGDKGKYLDFNEFNEKKLAQSIGYSIYPMDSHAVSKHFKYNFYNKKVTSYFHKGEGEFYLQGLTSPGIIPLGVIIPDKGANNLIVTQAVSATHVGYGTLRMEPTRMGMGQAGAVVASLSIDKNTNNFFEKSFLKKMQNRLIKHSLKLNPSEHNTKIFQDLGEKNSWYYDDVIDLKEKGAITFKQKFNPNQNITRAEFIKMAISLFVSEEDLNINNVLSFKDVNKNDWFYKYLNYAVYKGIIDRSKSEFNPHNSLNRAEASKVTIEVLEKIKNIVLEECKDKNNIFSDVKHSEWYGDYVCKLKAKTVKKPESPDEENILTGYDDGTFLPAKYINKAEASKILSLSSFIKG